jgi:hypothetical protein
MLEDMLQPCGPPPPPRKKGEFWSWRLYNLNQLGHTTNQQIRLSRWLYK